MTLISGIVATLLGGWLGDRLLRYTKGAYYVVSAIGMDSGNPGDLPGCYIDGAGMYPAIFCGVFFLLLNTAPLNAALVNSVGARIRATAVAVNLITIHILGDAFSPSLMGYISDKTNLRMAFLAATVARCDLRTHPFLWNAICAAGTRAGRHTCRGSFFVNWLLLVLGVLLAGVWTIHLIQAAMGVPSIAVITTEKWNLSLEMIAQIAGRVPRVTIVVAARNEEAKIEEGLRSLLALDYPEIEIIAVDDRSTDATGELMDSIARESAGKLHIEHVSALPAGWLGKTHAMWIAGRKATGDWILFTDADVIFSPDSLRRAIAYIETERADHLVLFPTMIMHTWDEQMMIGFFQTMFVFAPSSMEGR